MAGLPAIKAAKAVTVKAVAEKTYPDWFNVTMVVRSNLDHARIVFRPYNHETKELYPDSDKDLTMGTSGFFAYVAARPTLAVALAALTAELGKIASETEITNELEPLLLQLKEQPGLQEEVDALQAMLDAVTASFLL